MHGTGRSASPRRFDPKVVVGFVLAVIVGLAVWLVFFSKPAPSAAGLLDVPHSALTELNARVGAGHRYRPPGAIGTCALTGAMVTSRTDDELRLEVSSRCYFSPTDWHSKSPRPVSPGPTEDYRATLTRAMTGRWNVTRIKQVPMHYAHEG